MDGTKSVTIIHTKKIDELDTAKIVWEIIKLFQNEGLSYRQATELLEETKDQLKNIPINVVSR